MWGAVTQTSLRWMSVLFLVSWERFHTASGSDMLDTSPGSGEDENIEQKKEAKEDNQETVMK